MSERSVLVIDDDGGVAETFCEMLNAHRLDVRVASDAATGFAEIERSCPGAILVDFHLPSMNGVEFLNRLRANASQRDIPVAVITGDYLVDDQVIHDLERLNAKLFFKPLWDEDLVRIIEGLVASSRHRVLVNGPR